MTRYTKKPVTIDAFQWNGQPLSDWPKFAVDDVQLGKVQMSLDHDHLNNLRLIVYTQEGPLNASLGDWIIRGVKGEYYPCKPDIFEATYNPAEAEKEPGTQMPRGFVKGDSGDEDR